MNTVEKPMYEWNTLPWQDIERRVFKLQKRIYQASGRGEVKAVHRLQRLLIQSWSARCLAVRQVTQDNRGKRTAGVDGVKALTPRERLALVERLKEDMKPQPVRRKWIPKPGKDERRGLGIPTIQDRAHQALVKLALEPEWEAKFEANSYGFRPGRSCQDAIAAIRSHINQKPKYVLDADIAQCFDRINHTVLLKKMATYPKLRRVVKGWLKAGIMEDEHLFPTETGTPQGGVISPLLANVALHGMETDLKAQFPQRKIGPDGHKQHWQPALIRYADDLVVLHQDLSVIQHTQRWLAQWLGQIGLELKPSKTSISHTLEEHDGNIGFDFLGFTVRQYPVGKNHAPRQCGWRTGWMPFKTIIQPSAKALHRHMQRTGDIIDSHRMSTQVELIQALNPVIRGWTVYYAWVNAKQTQSKADYLTNRKLWRWVTRRHSNKSVKWKSEKYWPRRERRRFATAHGLELQHHTDIHIQWHIKVRGPRSPYDGDWAYWAGRMGRYPTLTRRQANLLKRQHGKCSYCGLYFSATDVVEIDHIQPRRYGGRDEYPNLQLLHGHCHDQKTAQEEQMRREALMTTAKLLRSRVR